MRLTRDEFEGNCDVTCWLYFFAVEFRGLKFRKKYFFPPSLPLRLNKIKLSGKSNLLRLQHEQILFTLFLLLLHNFFILLPFNLDKITKNPQHWNIYFTLMTFKVAFIFLQSAQNPGKNIKKYISRCCQDTKINIFFFRRQFFDLEFD